MNLLTSSSKLTKNVITLKMNGKNCFSKKRNKLKQAISLIFWFIVHWHLDYLFVKETTFSTFFSKTKEGWNYGLSPTSTKL